MTKLRLAAATCALMALGPAAARAQTARRSTAAPSQKPSFAPAPTAEPAPAVAAAPDPFVVAAPGSEPRVTGLAGVEIGTDQDFQAPKLRVDGEVPLLALSRTAWIGAVLSAGWIHYSKSLPANLGKVTSDTFELVPAFRFTFAVAPKVALRADTGLGAALTHAAGGGASANDTSAVLKFAGGLDVLVTSRFRLGAEIGLNFRFGESGSGNTVAVLLAGTWRP